MANYKIDDSILTDIADAIREKTGTTEPLEYPDEFISGIESIEGGGGGDDIFNSIVTGTISGTYINSEVAAIGSLAFCDCQFLQSVVFTNCTNIFNEAFENCQNLETVQFPICLSIYVAAFFSCIKLESAEFPECQIVGVGAFESCSSLKNISFPNCTKVSQYAFRNCLSLSDVFLPKCNLLYSSAFQNCQSLSEISLPECVEIASSAFYRCYNLVSLYLLGSTVCALAWSNVFNSTPIARYSASAGRYGSIFVPSSLLSQYKNSVTWSYFSSRFVGV